MDIKCRKCGEPWDAYGARHGDMEPDEYAKFMKGQGCPSCGFGTECTQCNGSGKESQLSVSGCTCCMGQRVVRVRRIAGHSRFGRWMYGYEPHMVVVADDVVASHFMKDAEGHESLDGWVTVKKIRCPNCWEQAPVCTWCKGTGKLAATTEVEEDRTLAFLSSVMENTDGDEIWEAIDALGG